MGNPAMASPPSLGSSESEKGAEKVDKPRKNSHDAPEDRVERTLQPKQIILTEHATYELREKRKQLHGIVSWTGKRRHDRKDVILDMERTDGELVRVSRIEGVALLANLLNDCTEPFFSRFLHVPCDLGISMDEPWRFTVSIEYEMTLPEFLSGEKNEDNKQEAQNSATLLQLAVHMFRAIAELHRLEIKHGSIRPSSFIVGTDRNCRKLLLSNFSRVAYNDPAPISVPVSDLPDLVFLPRGLHRNYELTKKDDLEGWAYVVAWIHHKMLLPWDPDNKFISKQDSSATKQPNVLSLKRSFCAGGLWYAMKDVMFGEFKEILKMLMDTKGTETPKYRSIWNLLCLACLRTELHPFQPLPWNPNNKGMLAEYGMKIEDNDSEEEDKKKRKFDEDAFDFQEPDSQ